MKKSKIVNRKSSINKAPQVLIRRQGRNVSRREAFEKAQVGFTKEYRHTWVEKVGWSRAYEEGWERIFGKTA